MDNRDNQGLPSETDSSPTAVAKRPTPMGVILQVVVFALAVLAFAAGHLVKGESADTGRKFLVSVVLILAGYGAFAVWGVLACVWPLPTVVHAGMAVLAVLLTAVSTPLIGRTAPRELGVDEDTIALLCHAVTLEMVLLPMARAVWKRHRAAEDDRSLN